MRPRMAPFTWRWATPQATLWRLLVGFALVASASQAATTGRPTGLSITLDSSSGPTLDFTIRMTTTGTDTNLGTIGSPIGFLGDFWSFQYTFFGTHVANRYRLLSPEINAIDFGDGSTIGGTALSMVTPGPPNVFAGSFTHTYPATGSYQLTANVWRGNLGSTATVAAPSPGTPITIGPSTRYVRQSSFPPSFTGPYTTSFYPSEAMVVGVSSTATVNLALDVPTLAEGALVVLALLLAMGGAWLLRR